MLFIIDFDLIVLPNRLGGVSCAELPLSYLVFQIILGPTLEITPVRLFIFTTQILIPVMHLNASRIRLNCNRKQFKILRIRENVNILSSKNTKKYIYKKLSNIKL